MQKTQKKEKCQKKNFLFLPDHSCLAAPELPVHDVHLGAMNPDFVLRSDTLTVTQYIVLNEHIYLNYRILI